MVGSRANDNISLNRQMRMKQACALIQLVYIRLQTLQTKLTIEEDHIRKRPANISQRERRYVLLNWEESIRVHDVVGYDVVGHWNL